jgi:hypothetical protein
MSGDTVRWIAVEEAFSIPKDAERIFGVSPAAPTISGVSS